jgi:hypothetical protein
VYVPVAGRASGRPAVSVILRNLEAWLTFVARFWRPFLSVRPSYSSLPSVPASTTSLYVMSPPSAPVPGSSLSSTLTPPLTSLSASTWNASIVLSAAAGRAAWGRAAAPSPAPTRTTQQRPPPFWKNP